MAGVEEVDKKKRGQEGTIKDYTPRAVTYPRGILAETTTRLAKPLRSLA